MTTPDENPQDPEPVATDEVVSATDDLKVGLAHLFSAARKAFKEAEPHLARGLEHAEKVFNRLGIERESLTEDLSRSVSTLAAFVSSRLGSATESNPAPVDEKSAPPDDGIADRVNEPEKP